MTDYTARWRLRCAVLGPWRVPFVVVAILAASTVAAQTRPLVTEEAATGGAGRLRLETGAEIMAAEPNFVTRAARARLDGPLLRLVYSPASNVELDLEWVALTYTPSDPFFGSVADFGDVTLRTKLLLRDAGPCGRRTSWAARYTLSLPQTSYGNGLGPNAIRMTAQALATRRVGSVRLHANGGLAILDEVQRAHRQRDLLAYGLAAEWTRGDRLTLVAEIAGQAGEGRPGADARGELRAGARFLWKRLHGDAALRRGLADADGTWGLTAGLTVTLRPPRPR
jgi:hypothetical protein